MTCSKCGAILPEGQNACPVCGTPSDATYVPKHAAPGPETVPVWDNVQNAAPANACPNCGKPALPGSAFCGYCGAPMGKPPVTQYVPQGNPAQPTPPEKRYSAPAKRTKVWIPVTAGVALLVVIAMVIAMFSSLGGPLLKIGAAGKKTVDAGNFTAEYIFEMDGVSIEGILYADINVKKQEVSVYTTVEADGAEVTMGIYDGYLFSLYRSGSYSYGNCQDIEDELEDIFDTYEETESKDLSDLLEQIEELMYDYTGEELSDYIDLDELEQSLKAYAKVLAKESWLKENMGYSKTKKGGETLYTFEPSMYDFLVASLPYFEDIFEDSDIYDDMMDALDDIGDDLDDEIAVRYTVGVKSGYLSTMSVVAEVYGEDAEITVKIYDVNKTKLDHNELEELLEECE